MTMPLKTTVDPTEKGEFTEMKRILHEKLNKAPKTHVYVGPNYSYTYMKYKDSDG